MEAPIGSMHACTAVVCLPLGVPAMHVLQVASAAATLDAVV